MPRRRTLTGRIERQNDRDNHALGRSAMRMANVRTLLYKIAMLESDSELCQKKLLELTEKFISERNELRTKLATFELKIEKVPCSLSATYNLINASASVTDAIAVKTEYETIQKVLASFGTGGATVRDFRGAFSACHGRHVNFYDIIMLIMDRLIIIDYDSKTLRVAN